MNFIVCRHPGDNGRYLFRLPEDVTLDAGSLVNVDTARGIQPAVCITSSFKADPEVICKMWGTEPPRMKRVISYLHESKLPWPESDKNAESANQENEEP